MKSDESTMAQFDPLTLAGRTVRSAPEVHWTDGAGAQRAAVDARTLIGGRDGVDIVGVAPAVSRLHAALEPQDDGLWIRDLGSRNGTFVNGVRVGFARVPERGRVRVGGTDLVVHYAQVETPVDLWPGDRFGRLLGGTSVMRELFARIAKIGPLASTVLIHGETGTGKELVARAIHDASTRAAKPFVVVDCGALTESLLEAELFGHTRGAFTGAVAARAGAFEFADGGTLFLDEVGELPSPMQPKLLRAIESRSIRRLGESAYRQVDVRIVSATHRDLATMVNAGLFREDLYFRLAVVPLVVPPLRARADDIPRLVETFLPPNSAPLDPGFVEQLRTQPWPGNVRELRNVVERAVALGPAAALGNSPMPSQPAMSARAPGTAETLPGVRADEPFKVIRDRWMDHLEREYLRALLSKHGRDTQAISNASGLDRSYVYRLMKKHEL